MMMEDSQSQSQSQRAYETEAASQELLTQLTQRDDEMEMTQAADTDEAQVC